MLAAAAAAAASAAADDASVGGCSRECTPFACRALPCPTTALHTSYPSSLLLLASDSQLPLAPQVHAGHARPPARPGLGLCLSKLRLTRLAAVGLWLVVATGNSAGRNACAQRAVDGRVQHATVAAVRLGLGLGLGGTIELPC